DLFAFSGEIPYVYIFRTTNSKNVDVILNEVFIQIYPELSPDIKIEELENKLYNISDFCIQNYFLNHYKTEDCSPEAWLKIWRKSKEFVQNEKEISRTVGKILNIFDKNFNQ